MQACDGKYTQTEHYSKNLDSYSTRKYRVGGASRLETRRDEAGGLLSGLHSTLDCAGLGACMNHCDGIMTGYIICEPYGKPGKPAGFCIMAYCDIIAAEGIWLTPSVDGIGELFMLCARDYNF